MTTLTSTRPDREFLRRAARFLAVGALGTLIDLSLFSALALLLGVPPLLANSVSYGAGILNNYALHRAWTFAGRTRAGAPRQFARFAAVSLSALALSNLVVAGLAPVLDAWLADPSLSALGAKIAALGLGFAWNFTANQRWTFRPSSGAV